ncbi:MAG: hypothetical protein R6U59_08035 [Eubacteriales bacterium]
MSNFLDVIFSGMVTDFGNAWVVIGMAAFVLLAIFFIVTQDFLASAIMTMLPFSMFAIANFEGVETLIPYLIIILGVIMAVILSKIFSR